MRWEQLGVGALALWCSACGEAAGNPPSTSSAGGGAGEAAGGSKNGAGGAAAGSDGKGGASGGVGVGMCSGSTNHKGGTRLKSKFWVTAEGDRAWDTLWDTELNHACSFNRASDGKMRCIPNNWDDSIEVFSDASCTQALYTRMQIGPCTSADYIMRVNQGSCEMPGGYAFYTLGAAATPTKVYQKSGVDCVQNTRLTEPLYAMGAEVPSSTFLEGAPTLFEAPARIHPWGFSATDGTRAVQSWQDTEADQSCFFELSEDGKTRCLPFGGFIADYSDAACSSVIMTTTTKCDSKVPSYALQGPEYQCAKPFRVFKRADVFTGVPYIGSAETCTAGTANPEVMSYTTTPAGPELFQAVVDTVDATDPGRLKPRYYDAGGDGCWFHNFWDSELMTPCGFAEATDMKQRCLPSTQLKVLSLFTDDQCTVRAGFSPVDECVPAQVPAYSTNIEADECARRSQVWKVGAAVLKAELPPLWTNTTGTCIPATPKEEQFLRLTLVDPSQFMAGESQLE
jgi:hypothetical protein